MEVNSFSSVENRILVCSVMEALLAETLVLAGKSLACLLMLTGSVLNDMNASLNSTALDKRFPFDELLKKEHPGPENKDASDTEDDDDDEDNEENVDDDDDDDDADDEDFSAEEGEGGDPEDDPEANGDAGNDEEDDDDEDDDDDDGDDDDGEDDDAEDEGEEDEEDEDDEVPQPPSKKRK